MDRENFDIVFYVTIPKPIMFIEPRRLGRGPDLAGSERRDRKTIHSMDRFSLSSCICTMRAPRHTVLIWNQGNA